MRIILTFLSLSFILGCHQPSSHSESSPTDGGEQILEAPTEVAHDKRDIQDTDPKKLSCEEAIELFAKIAQNANRQCQKAEDCVRLGVNGNCDCYQWIQGAGHYAKENTLLSSLHERIFPSCKYYDPQKLPCKPDYTTGAYTLYCEEGLCMSRKPSIDHCGPEKNP